MTELKVDWNTIKKSKSLVIINSCPWKHVPHGCDRLPESLACEIRQSWIFADTKKSHGYKWCKIKEVQLNLQKMYLNIARWDDNKRYVRKVIPLDTEMTFHQVRKSFHQTESIATNDTSTWCDPPLLSVIMCYSGATVLNLRTSPNSYFRVIYRIFAPS